MQTISWRAGRVGANAAKAMMTATIYLIRHAAHGHLGRTLSGRMPGVALSETGTMQADALADYFSALPPDVIQSSPVQRAQETARQLAARCDRGVETVAALDEIDFGEWTGRAFAELEGDADWTIWNERRSDAVPPGGEPMREAQERAWGHVLASARKHGGGSVAMVTHCDIIRAVLARILGLSLDAIHRFEVLPASVSRIAVGDWGARVHSINEEVR